MIILGLLSDSGIKRNQGVTKRCRLSWLTNCALVYEPKCGELVAGSHSQAMSTAVHMEPMESEAYDYSVFSTWVREVVTVERGRVTRYQS